MADVFHRNFFLNGPAGKLEALLWTSALDNPPASAVVCHPHPLFSGTMHNKVIYQVAKTLQHRGMPVLRFNFRGAGLSEGEHAGGFGERGDVRAAIDFLAAEFPARPILLAGFSFGSWVGLRVGCSDDRVTKLIGLGVPVDKSNLEYLHDCQKPKLIVQGGNDEFGSRQNVEALFSAMPEPKKLVIVESVDHFFAGKLPEVGAAIDSWLDSQPNQLPEPPSHP